MAKEYLAKSDGTALYEHSCRVCDMAISILDDAGITDRAIKTAVMTAALSHDMGKTMPSYQEFIRKTVEVQEKEPYTDNFPRHNEVSASLFKYMVRTALGPSYQNLIAAAIEYHHTCTGIITTLGQLPPPAAQEGA